MWKNYLKVAFRNLMRYKIFSFINIFGLGVSMALSLVVITLVLDQYKYDRHNSRKDRIYRVNTLSQKYKPTATTTMALKEVLLSEVSGVEKAARIKRGFGNMSMMDFKQDINIPITGYFADPEVLDVFELELESGNPETALVDPYSVVLTRETADKLFKNPDPLGETIKVGEQGEFKVTGILKDKPGQKSHVMFEGLASFSTVPSLNAADSIAEDPLTSWSAVHEGYLYILLDAGQSTAGIEQQLQQIAKSHYAEDDPGKHDFVLQNLTEIAMGPDINNPIGPFLPRIFVIFLGALAAIVMLTSCFNYTNLSIARSLTRAKEIGIRKVTGAKRSQIFLQFISEALLTATLALAFSWIIVVLSKPYLLDLRLVQLLRWDFSTSLEVYPYLIGFALIVGIFSGFFPAVVLSSLQPIRVLKNFSSIKLLSRFGLRKTLLVLQFAISLIFIVSAILVYRQTDLFLNKDRGFEVDHKVLVKLNQTNAEQLKAELIQQSNVVSVSAVSHIPGAGVTMGDEFKVTPEAEKYEMDYFHVDEDYLTNMGLGLLAGKNFNPQNPESNKTKILINELAVEKFGFGSPSEAIGQVMYRGNDPTLYEIIGVVPNYIHRHMLMENAPMALFFNPDEFSQLQVNYSGSDEAIISTLNAAWNKVNPDLKINFQFFEVEMNEMYNVFFGVLGKVVGLVAFLAITISCLGLLGMASYAAEVKTKEVAIRKSLGASVPEIALQLSMGFVKLVGIAILFGLPAAWFVNNLWLENLAYRVNIGVGTISLSLLFIFVLTLLTVGSQALKAAFLNPSNNLRNE